MHRQLLSILVVGLSFSLGCTPLRQWHHNGWKVGPNYCRPAAPVAERWINAYEQEFVEGCDSGEFWWQAFGDPTLDQLIRVAYQQNRNLRTAGLRVLQAQYIRAIAAGNFFPQAQTADGSFTNTRTSRNSPTAFPGIPRDIDSWTTGLSLAWELDFWGRFRRNIEAADAGLDATIEDYDFVLVSLIADVATTYVQIRSLEERLQFARDNAEIQAQTLEITRTKERLGALGATGLEINQAVSNFKSTEALIPQLELSKRQLQNALSVLLGIPPRDLTEVLGTRGLPAIPDQVVVDIPANLLRRRPDIRSSERQVAAQSARIGVAIADLYPQFSIAGTLSLEAAEFADLFDAASQAGAISPGFRWNILNYGRLRNNVRVEENSFLQLVTTYENTVLNAQREVEDAMARFLYANRRVDALREAAEAAAEAVRLGRVQWREGKIAFNQVFVLESNLTTSQDSLAATRLEVARGLIDIYRALGGGWQLRYRVPYCGFAELQPVIVESGDSVPADAEAPPDKDEYGAAVENRTDGSTSHETMKYVGPRT